MERIDIHNYEAYLLDLSEGSLSFDRRMELELFLIQHPELNIDLNELALVSLEKEEISFSEKNNLKRSETDLVSGTQFICYIENQLSPKEKRVLEKSCSSNPSLAHELGLYQQTILKADPAITYSDKDNLKRGSTIIWFDFSVTKYAVAACILFLIGLFILWPKPDATGLSSELAEHDKTKTTPPLNNTADTVEKKYDLKIKNIPPVTLAQNSNHKKKLVIKNKSSFTDEKPLKDTIKQNTKEPENTNVNESLLASVYMPPVNKSNNTVVQVITESDEDPIDPLATKKKKGLWALASKALKNLNHVGVKSVNGNEDKNQDKASYALTLGGVNITHKAAKL